MGTKIQIEGLKAVAPPVPAERGPVSISEEELGKLVRFYQGPQLDVGTVTAALLDIQDQLQAFANRGMNSDNIGVEDFGVAAISADPVGSQPQGFVSTGPQIVFQSMKTSRHAQVVAFPPAGVTNSNFHYPTATLLINLAS